MVSRRRNVRGFYPPPPSRKGEKPCPHCKETKPLTAFHWNKHNGYWESWCNRCRNYSEGFACARCGAPVSNAGGRGAVVEGREVRCRNHMERFDEPTPIRHGTEAAYGHRGCRCDECRAAATASRRRRRHEVTAGIRPPVSHGTHAAYSNGCRCGWCLAATNEYHRRLRRKKRRNAA